MNIRDYLNAEETAELLRCSPSNIYRLSKRPNDPLPGKRLGGTLLFSRAAIDAWIARQPDIAPSSVAVPAVAPNNVIPIRGNANADQIQTHRTVAHEANGLPRTQPL